MDNCESGYPFLFTRVLNHEGAKARSCTKIFLLPAAKL